MTGDTSMSMVTNEIQEEERNTDELVIKLEEKVKKLKNVRQSAGMTSL